VLSGEVLKAGGKPRKRGWDLDAPVSPTLKGWATQKVFAQSLKGWAKFITPLRGGGAAA